MALVSCNKKGSGPDAPLRVAAAADLGPAFGEVGSAFERASGRHVEFVFGSSGLLAKQIEQGAPFDAFAAADVSFVNDVIRSGACIADTKALYARGHLVLWAPDPATLPRDLAGLAEPRYRKIAIANPEHAPYGRAAREALASAGVLHAVESRIVYGENVQQALTFAKSGNADVAIVALSLVASSPNAGVAVDEHLHAPLDQALVVCHGAKLESARAFTAYVASAPGRAILRRYGFLLPGESSAR